MRSVQLEQHRLNKVLGAFVNFDVLFAQFLSALGLLSDANIEDVVDCVDNLPYFS